jgi:hypothetical protein
MTAAAYRQHSARTPALDQIDPDNRLLGRMNLRRLEAEAVRDAVLAVSGKLNPAMGGPSVPVVEDGEGKASLGKRKLNEGIFSGVEGVGDQAGRRSIYVQVKRVGPLAVLDTFDLPAMNPNCDLRRSSTVATQALLFLNDDFAIEQSEALADRLWREAPSGDEARINRAYRLLYAAEPTTDELARCRTFLAEQTKRFAADADKEWQARVKKQPNAPSVRALAAMCQTMLCGNRFLYVD